jgi:hypothetical protein
MVSDRSPGGRNARYARFCRSLEKLGAGIGVSAQAELARDYRGSRSDRASRRRCRRLERLRTEIGLAEMRIPPGTVLAAARALTIVLAVAVAVLVPALYLASGPRLAASLALVSPLLLIAAREALLSHPSREAARSADEVLRTSCGTTNLMIMSLRHESSVSRAIAFASGGSGRFARELRRCAWGVIMGTHTSFEEALIDLGERWSRFSEDLKASLNAMVTASSESTEDGRRRALDRANNAMISGARRRIEEYALSLSVPSMLIFGLGILLPLMVGSFMPMLSWNLWSTEEIGASRSMGGVTTDIQTMFVMNFLFPSIAALVAMNAVEGHPMVRSNEKSRGASKGLLKCIMAAIGASIPFAFLSISLLSGTALSVALLFSAIGPAAAMLVLRGSHRALSGKKPEGGLEDALFRTGARMLEGENFESSLRRAFLDSAGQEDPLLRRVSLRSAMLGLEEGLPGDDDSGASNSNAYDGLRIARRAAEKDELAAGMLAMDLAAYLKDLRELKAALLNRLKPTVSMMKTTALLLAPIVLGITYAIYLSLASMTGGHNAGSARGEFFLVLGFFLAEMDAVVVYFVNGIGGGSSDSIAFTLGGYLLASEATFASTALLASM